PVGHAAPDAGTRPRTAAALPPSAHTLVNSESRGKVRNERRRAPRGAHSVRRWTRPSCCWYSDGKETERMRGLMQDSPLILSHLRQRASRLFANVPIASRTAGGMMRYTYGDCCRRVARLANVLQQLGVRPGDRVGTFAWNSHRHLELYLAIPSFGAVLHTV